MIQTPFPELEHFVRPSRLPSLEKTLASLPLQEAIDDIETPDREIVPAFPSFNKARTTTPPSLPALKKPLPTPPKLAKSKTTLNRQKPSTPMPTSMANLVADAMDDEPRAATDDDLRRAFEPIVEGSLERVLYAPDKGLHTYLEPMLRSTVRRAIAEQIDAAVQFRSTSTTDRLGWRLKALMTSRSYDEVVFHSTRRYQVEETFLLRKEDYSLISFASHDPARHASEKRVAPTIKKLTTRLIDSEGNLRKTFEYNDEQLAIIREGDYTLLVALVRGRSNALVRADLDYVLRQAEERFGERFEVETDAFLHVLQPILEGALLIQSPAPPN